MLKLYSTKRESMPFSYKAGSVVVVLLACCPILRSSASPLKSDDCVAYTDSYSAAYGFPFQYSCTHLFRNIKPQDVDDIDRIKSEIHCVTEDLNTEQIVKKKTCKGKVYTDCIYHLPAVSSNTSKHYVTTIRKGRLCWKHNFTLNITDHSKESCKESFEMGRYITSNNLTLLETYKLTCSNKPGPPLPDTIYYWLFNCTTKLPENVRLRESNRELQIRIANGKNNGLYTCMIEHQNRTMANIHYNYSVAHERSVMISPKCSRIRAKIGETLQVTCEAGVILGTIGMYEIGAEMSKVGANQKCYSDSEERKKLAGGRISCYIKSTRKNLSGYNSEIEQNPLAQRLWATNLQMIYEISDFTLSDVGRYSITVIYFGYMKENTTFTIFLNEQDVREKTRIEISFGIAFITILILIFLIFWRFFRLEMRWVYSKLSTIQESGKQDFSAYLTYHYSKIMSSNTSTSLKTLVFNLSAFIEKNGGKIYDECREPCTGEPKPEIIIEKLRKCGRTIVILTPDYIQNEWGVFETLQAYERSVENDVAKILFIRIHGDDIDYDNLPGLSKSTIKRMLKAHDVIDWDGAVPFSRRMKIQLDLFFSDSF